MASDESKGSHLLAVLNNASPWGQFYILHLLRQIFAWSAFASAAEATPYLFPALRKQYEVGTAEMSNVAGELSSNCAKINCAI